MPAAIPSLLTIDWDDGEFEGRLAAALPLLVTQAEAEALRRARASGASGDRAACADARETDAAFLVKRIEALPASDRAARGDARRAGRWLPAPGERATARAARAAFFDGRAVRVPQRAAGADADRTSRPSLRARRGRCVRSGTRDGDARRSTSRAAAMVTRSRDLDAFAHGDPRDVRLVDDGDGLSFALIGVLPERRLFLPAVYGALSLRNGVPIGYVQLDVLFGNAEVSFNTFETFRGGEAGFVFCRLLAAARHVFGVTSFSIEPYQLGRGNDEAILTGAWWFYARFGFRPRDRKTSRLARDGASPSARAIPSTAPAGRRSSAAGRSARFLAATRRFAHRDHADGVDRVRPRSQARGAVGADREAAVAACEERAATRLGVRSLARWRPASASGGGVGRRCSMPFRARSVELRRASRARPGRARERGRREHEFARLFDAHPRLRRAVLAFCRRKPIGCGRLRGLSRDSGREGPCPDPHAAATLAAAPSTVAAAGRRHLSRRRRRGPYRWLESGSDPEVGAWIAAQNDHTRADPRRLAGTRRAAEPGDRADGLRIGRLRSASRGGRPAVRDQEAAAARADAARRRSPTPTISAASASSSIRTCSTPRGGRRSTGTCRRSTARRSRCPSPSREPKAATCTCSTRRADATLGDVVPRVNGGTGGRLARLERRRRGFYYTRYPSPGERPPEELGFDVHVYWHRLGSDPAARSLRDRARVPAHRRDPPRIEPRRAIHARLACSRGTAGSSRTGCANPRGAWHALTRYEDRCVAARLGPDGAIYFVSLLGAPRGCVLAAAPDDVAREASRPPPPIVPEGGRRDRDVVRLRHGTVVRRRSLYVLYQQGGPNAVRAFDLDGRREGEIPQPPLSAVDDVVVLPAATSCFKSRASPCRRRGTARPTAEGGRSCAPRFAETSPADYSDCEVVREEAVSPDGTRVPITVLRLRGHRARRNPPDHPLRVLAATASARRPDSAGGCAPGSSAAGSSRSPTSAAAASSARRGIARAASSCKQNVFDDFAACARRMSALGYATREKLALMGGSNGGLLMGAMITQHPELGARRRLAGRPVRHAARRAHAERRVQRAGVRHRRRSRDVPGAARLLAVPPASRTGRPTRRSCMATGENDPRVDSWQSRKMIARLQAATSSPCPILLRTNLAAGHGRGTPARDQIDEYTDVLGFLMRELRGFRDRGHSPSRRAQFTSSTSRRPGHVQLPSTGGARS
mgnify:CR=1 FL=1